MTIRGIRHLLHHQLCLLGFEHLLKYTAGSQATTSSGQHIHTLHISTLPFRLDCLRKKQDSIPLRTARQGHGLFLYWTLSCGSLDCSATKHAVCASENEELKKNRVLLHHRNRTTKKHVSRYMGIFAMWKVTDKQIILAFGSTIKQPAEPHGEHEQGKLASCGQVTHILKDWCGSCLPAVSQ